MSTPQATRMTGSGRAYEMPFGGFYARYQAGQIDDQMDFVE